MILVSFGLRFVGTISLTSRNRDDSSSDDMDWDLGGTFLGDLGGLMPQNNTFCGEGELSRWMLILERYDTGMKMAISEVKRFACSLESVERAFGLGEGVLMDEGRESVISAIGPMTVQKMLHQKTRVLLLLDKENVMKHFFSQGRDSNGEKGWIERGRFSDK